MDIANLSAYSNPYAADAATAYQSSSFTQQAVIGLNQSPPSYQTKISDYGQIQSTLSSLQAAAAALNNVFSANTSTAPPGVVIANSGSAVGSYAVSVDQLAQSQTLLSATQASATAAIGSGASTVLTFQSPNNPSQNVTIDSSNNTLFGIASAINNANIGYTASVTASGSSFQLQIAGQTGSTNVYSITATGDSSVSNLVSYQSNSASNKMQQVSVAQNAQGSVNGAAFSSATNNNINAGSGLYLNLVGTGSTTVSVASDAAKISSTMQSFVDAFNSAQSTLTKLSKGDLSSDASLTAIKTQLVSMLNAANGSNSTLLQAGISGNPDGGLTLDQNTLQDTVSSNLSGLSRLFSNGGIADTISSQIQNTMLGNIQNTVSGLQSQDKANLKTQLAIVPSPTPLTQNLTNQYGQLQQALSSARASNQLLTSKLIQTNQALSNLTSLTPEQYHLQTEGQLISDLPAIGTPKQDNTQKQATQVSGTHATNAAPPVTPSAPAVKTASVTSAPATTPTAK